MAQATEHHQSRLSEVLTVALVFLFGAVSFMGVNALVQASDNIRTSHQLLAETATMERSAVALQLAILSNQSNTGIAAENTIERSRDTFAQSLQKATNLLSTRSNPAAMSAALSDIRGTIRSVTIISGEDPSYLETRYAASTMRDALNAFKRAVQEQLSQDEKAWKRLSGLATSIVAIGTILLIAFAWFQVRVSADFRRQAIVLDEERHKLEDRDWVKTIFSELSGKLQNIKNQEIFAETIMRELTPLIGGNVGIYYAAVRQDDDSFILEHTGSYAFSPHEDFKPQLAFGEGLVGQSALENRILHMANSGTPITTSSATIQPVETIIFPLSFEGKIFAVIEIGAGKPFSDAHKDLIEEISASYGVILSNLSVRLQTVDLLRESQAKSVELAAQTDRLKESQEELRLVNDELSAQKDEIEEAHRDVKEKADQLAEASKYKSEFLANMSHELRTPLNSLLILSKMLSDNAEGNLTDNQIEDARIIHEGGQDLLELINDIMDLSKVEAGMLEIHEEDVSLNDIARNMQSLFGPLAQNKGLDFIIEQDDRLPRHLKSDDQRIQQILKNFLSNAFKFTEQGSIKLAIETTKKPGAFNRPELQAGETIALSVKDSGIGIAEDKLQAIFEAFQQEDGSTSRKYGGTGLGLSISTNLAHLLGGEIQVESTKGEGSCFTLYLPLVEFDDQSTEEPSAGEPTLPSAGTPPPASPTANLPSASPMDSPAIQEEAHILVVEDDAVFANVLRNAAEKQGFVSSITASGREALYFAIENQPSCILLDIGLPDISGMDVLAQLKTHKETAAIPVHVISADDHEAASLGRGAVDFLMKPPTSEDVASLFKRIETSESQQTTVLLVEDDSGQRSAIKRLLQDTSSAITTADSGRKALDLLAEIKFDCMILDIGLPDMDGFEVIENVAEWAVEDRPAIIVHTARDLTDSEMKRIATVTSDIIVKGPQSGDQLLGDLSRFFETVASQNDLPEDLRGETATANVLDGKHLLIVDDDMRNVFALSRQLGGLGLDVSIAEDGQKALTLLEEAAEEQEQIDMILMDIMMPVMDGYEAMPLIRQMSAYAGTPMLALTANAMPEDREKCIQAGASDYLSKPVNMDRLVAMLRVWMYP